MNGTVRLVCRPQENPRIVYNEYKRLHEIKFQSLVTINEMIARLDGPYESKKHDSSMLTESNLLAKWNNHSCTPFAKPFCIHGDPVYPLRVHLQWPYWNNTAWLIQNQEAHSKAMSQVRSSTEWVFDDIVNYFASLDYRKNLKIGLNSVGKMYVTRALIRNAYTCMYKSITSYYFRLDSPLMKEYFLWVKKGKIKATIITLCLVFYYKTKILRHLLRSVPWTRCSRKESKVFKKLQGVVR